MDEAREFDPDAYDDAISYLEELAASGVRRVWIERWAYAGWRPLFAGPPSLGVYGLARLEEMPARPRVRLGPATGAPHHEFWHAAVW